MDYEKKYEKLVDAVKVLRDNNPSDEGIQNWVNDNVPELKESEDEKIKKDIIKYLKNSTATINKRMCQSWIAWLENKGQKETDPRYENLEELLAADDIYQMAMNDDMVQEAKTKAIDALSELEIGKLLGIENQSEQKPKDKVEPKFHSGDWVVDTVYDKAMQVLFLEDDGYEFENGIWIPYADAKERVHLWTIKDAKDGDVLQLGKVTAIFKEFIGNNNCKCYCSVCNGEFEIHRQVDDSCGCHNATPATKEQRDLLSQKMKEAGYVWDADKKEVKKIEQKPTDKVEPKFKQGEWIVWKDKYYKVNYNGCGYELFDQNGLSTSWDYKTIEDNAHLWTIQDAKDCDVLVGSEWDVILMFRGIGNTEWDDVIDYHCYYDYHRKDFIVQKDLDYWGNTENNQLKPATKEQRDLLFQKMKEAGFEWDSEKKELEKIHVIDEGKAEMDYCFTKMMNGERVSSVCSEEYEEVNGEDYGINGLWHAKRILEKTLGGVEGYQSDYGILEHKAAINAVKKLYEQKSWSEDDESMLKSIIATCELAEQDRDSSPARHLFEMQSNWLKSLKDKMEPQWKPSDEQMHYLSWIANIKLGDSVVEQEVSKHLNELYEDLKKLK